MKAVPLLPFFNISFIILTEEHGSRVYCIFAFLILQLFLDA